jgi:hypothetical protein
MSNIIIVDPVDGHFSFNVKYCYERVSIPMFSCSIEDLDQLIVPLKDFGCDDKQISTIIDMIMENREGEVDVNGAEKPLEDW